MQIYNTLTMYAKNKEIIDNKTFSGFSFSHRILYKLYIILFFVYKYNEP